MRHLVLLGAITIFVIGNPIAAQEKKPNVEARFEGHIGGVTALAFHPNKTLIVTGAGNGVVRLWNIDDGKVVYPLNPLKASGGTINLLGFSSDGYLLSTSSHNAVVVWNLYQLLVPPKETPDPKIEPKQPPMLQPPPPPEPILVFEDGLGTDPAKLGIVTGNGRRVFISGTEGVRVTVNSRALSPQFGIDTIDELNGAFTPWAMAAIDDPESGMVAMYGALKGADKTEEPVVALFGLGDAKVIGKGTVRARVAGRPASIALAPDGKWLLVCNGQDLMYWPVPGSQMVEGKPKLIAGASAYVVAAGPKSVIAFASPPEEGKTVKVTIMDLSSDEPKVVAEYPTEIARVSCLAFSPDGSLLGVGDDREGVVQVWNLE